MILTEAGVVNYLLYRGLISAEIAISNQLEIRQMFSRNRNFLISVNEKRRYFLKQISTVTNEKIQTLKKEANFYWMVKNNALFQPLQPYVCELIDYNSQINALIVEAISEGQDLFQYLQKNRNLEKEVAESLATALAAFHKIAMNSIVAAKAQQIFPKVIPWIFRIDDDNRMNLHITTPASKQVVEIVNAHANYIELIRANRDQWETKSLVHGDIKFPNLFIDRSTGAMSIKLIDMEISDIGDPCWDVAGVFQAFLTWWVDFANSDNEQLIKLQPSINQFWKKYIESLEVTGTNEKIYLIKSMQYAAIRMIQTCYEMAGVQQTLQPNQVKTLQMSLNILLNPENGCKDLLGIN
ncbi:MAG: aminoglycoside phosphotransferase family protein [Bacteroidetes bacterium]|nr:aminoglycoside phosphotransferase family protein [Bacteroidota bacterium]